MKYLFILLIILLSLVFSPLMYGQEAPVLSAMPITLDVLEVKNEGLLEALELIAVKSGARIIVDPKIQGKVSIYLKNVDLYDVLRVILEANGMAFSKIEGSEAQNQDMMALELAGGKIILGGMAKEKAPDNSPAQGPIIEVMTAREFEIKFGASFGEKIQTKIISLIHSRGEEVLEILGQMKGPSGKIIYNEPANTLVLIDAPDKLKAMTTVVEEWDAPLVTKEFYLKYVIARDMLPLVKEALNPETGKVEMEEAANTLIITDKGLRLKEIEELIKKLDIEERHILIETKILQIILSDEHQEGVDWEAIVSGYQSLAFNLNPVEPPAAKKESIQNFNLASSNGQNPADKLSLGTISEEDYAVLLDALDTVGDIHIISNMKISTLHNKAAELMIKALNYQSFDKTQGRIPRKEDENRDEAQAASEIKFQITPSVNADQTLSLNIKQGEPSAGDEQGQGPARVNVKVQQGSTVVMGGLFKETMVELKEKIPLLGDIPILGLAFRHQGPRPRKAEIIVFLTPKVVIKE